MGANITGTGHYVPTRVLGNDDLERMVNTSDAWIVRRTGIRTRHILSEEEIPADMAVHAARRAMDAAGVEPAAIDLLLVATNFPDMPCPGTSPFVASGIGLGVGVPFFDLSAGCSGFVYGLAIADALVTAGAFSNVLLIGSEALSRVVDWTDRKTCVLFGDGAGAVMLTAGSDGRGVLSTALHGDHEKAQLLCVPGGGTRHPASTQTVDARLHYLRMEGAGVYRSAVPMMANAVHEALERAGLEISDADWIIPHQANQRIIDSLVKRLGVPDASVIVNLDRVANTSTASIPIALDEAVRSGRVAPGDIVVLTAFGAGASYGAAVVRL